MTDEQGAPSKGNNVQLSNTSPGDEAKINLPLEPADYDAGIKQQELDTMTTAIDRSAIEAGEVGTAGLNWKWWIAGLGVSLTLWILLLTSLNAI